MSMPPNALRVVTRACQGLRMSPEQFDAIEEFEEGLDFELIDGLLVVTPSCTMQEAVENDYLGYLLELYQERHFSGRSLDLSLAESIVRLADARLKLDRALWTGLGREPVEGVDVPSIGVEFREADAKDDPARRLAFFSAGLREYWTFDRAQGTLSVAKSDASGGETTLRLDAGQEYQSPLLPGFRLPIGRIFEEAREYGQDAD